MMKKKVGMILPPDYELDDYWMKEVVLKDEKDEESEFYSAYGYFSSYPLPDYIAKKIASAPPYDWYKYHSPTTSSSSSMQLQPSTPLNFIKPTNQRKRSFNSSPSPEIENEKKRKKKNNVSVPVLPTNNHYCLKICLKKQKGSNSWALAKKDTTSTDQYLQKICHHQADHDHDDHSRKPSTCDQIVSAVAVIREPILPDQHELIISNLITAKLGGCDNLLLVIEKKLTYSDLNSQQNRFSIPFRQVLNGEFLNSEEKILLDNKETKNMDVNVLICNSQQQQQPYLEGDKVECVNFTKWEVNSMYVLNRQNWRTIVARHKLEEDMQVQLWAFRLRSLLSFALVKT